MLIFLKLFPNNLFCFLLLTKVLVAVSRESTNILLILADDLGYADVDWHDYRLFTPNLRYLAFSKHTTYLTNSYVNQLCTPTRSALMTGMYPFRTGTQEGVFLQSEPSGVPFNFTFFPQELRKVGYRNYMIGKWHLGYCKKDYLPTVRGFDSFYGFYGAQEGYFNHSSDIFEKATGKMIRGLDLFREVNGVSVPDFSKNGIYSTHLFTDETLSVLENHKKVAQKSPFFLYLSFQSVHAPLQVPVAYKEKCFAFSKESHRQIYCAMLCAMDEAIGRVVEGLKRLELYQNTLIIFTSDNGGDPYYGASNFPLRGQKNTLWEGGTKTITFIHAPQYIKAFTQRTELFHVVDWYATILSIANFDNVDKYDNDGISQWGIISGNYQQKHVRQQFVYNINTVSAIRKHNYKLIYEFSKGLHFWNTNFQTLRKFGRSHLFDLSLDPYEQNDIARQQPFLVQHLVDTIFQHQQSGQKSVRRVIDGAHGNPSLMGGAYNSYWC